MPRTRGYVCNCRWPRLDLDLTRSPLRQRCRSEHPKRLVAIRWRTVENSLMAAYRAKGDLRFVGVCSLKRCQNLLNKRILAFWVWVLLQFVDCSALKAEFHNCLLTWDLNYPVGTMQKPPRWCPWISTTKSDLDSFFSARNRFCNHFPSQHIWGEDSVKNCPVTRAKPTFLIQSGNSSTTNHVACSIASQRPKAKYFKSWTRHAVTLPLVMVYAVKTCSMYMQFFIRNFANFPKMTFITFWPNFSIVSVFFASSFSHKTLIFLALPYPDPPTRFLFHVWKFMNNV